MNDQERDQLHRFLAEVMGWKQIAKWWCLSGREGIQHIILVSDWQPSRLIQQAMMVLDSKFNQWILECDAGVLECDAEGYGCHIFKPTRQVFFLLGSGRSPSKEEAICLAVEAAVAREGR